MDLNEKIALRRKELEIQRKALKAHEDDLKAIEISKKRFEDLSDVYVKRAATLSQTGWDVTLYGSLVVAGALFLFLGFVEPILLMVPLILFPLSVYLRRKKISQYSVELRENVDFRRWLDDLNSTEVGAMGRGVKSPEVG